MKQRLIAAISQSQDSAQLEFQLANLANLEGDYVSAELLYRKCLDANPKHVAACNELSYILAVQKKNLPEALELVNRAIEISGPLPTLLDTRSTGLIAKAEYQQAIADLNNALSDGPRPEMYFHLALAYQGLGEEAQAQNAIDAATKQGLDAQICWFLSSWNTANSSRSLKNCLNRQNPSLCRIFHLQCGWGFGQIMPREFLGRFA